MKINNGGPKDRAKQMAFRRAAQRSKRFIHQSASYLARQSVAGDYAEYCRAADNDALRKGA